MSWEKTLQTLILFCEIKKLIHIKSKLHTVAFVDELISFECFASMYACAPHVPNAHGGQQRVLNPLELCLRMVVSHCVHARTGTQVLCNSNKCCKPRSPLLTSTSSL